MTLAKEAKKIRQRIKTAEKFLSSFLDGTTTTTIINFSTAASKFTVQADGDLTFTVNVTVNGKDFTVAADITSAAANAISSYSTNIVSGIKITRTAGSGEVTVLVNQ